MFKSHCSWKYCINFAAPKNSDLFDKTIKFHLASNKLDCYAEIYDTPEQAEVQQMYGDENDEETRNRIVDDCIQRISPRCAEILTMFYYEEKTLDEILAARHETNSSKNGLKTAKNKCMNTLRSLCNEEFRKYNI